MKYDSCAKREAKYVLFSDRSEDHTFVCEACYCLEKMEKYYLNLKTIHDFIWDKEPCSCDLCQRARERIKNDVCIAE